MIKSNTNITENSMASVDMLLCPQCMINIPYITLSKEPTFITVLCPCSTYKSYKLDLVKYLNKMEMPKAKICNSKEQESNEGNRVCKNAIKGFCNTASTIQSNQGYSLSPVALKNIKCYLHLKAFSHY